MTATRPDIQFAICLCVRYQDSPRTSHLQAVKRIFRYLKFTIELGVWYSLGSSLSHRGFSDADHAGCRIDRKSTSGTCQLLGTSLVSWSSRKQARVALFTTEAEYVAAASCCSQLLWMKATLSDFGLRLQVEGVDNALIKGEIESQWTGLIALLVLVVNHRTVRWSKLAPIGLKFSEVVPYCLVKMSQPSTQPFDLCPNYQESMRAKTILPRDPKKRKAEESSTKAASVQHLQPGMVLLKGFVKPEDQIEVIRMCRQLGKGPRGFYRPSLKNGAKLNLWMMSLEKNRDPTARSYGPTRPFDGAQAPTIPDAFKMIAQTANSTASEFPQINPDICIVNYTNSGKLGLHQDKDE
ncbi:hypothetical protein U9M48_002798 [Paspalum notatum var. saurae]|uniref:Alpha-ketoglutarate-dependent dioxygenase AlkB-like domain-containing protein n=1 Tax=Paspalum notatum var. saurae TaxID=547442 RepID=A0AAQ3PRR1_PASNO